MSQPRPTDRIGSIGWTERTGGVLTARECLTSRVHWKDRVGPLAAVWETLPVPLSTGTVTTRDAVLS
jgi:hypothetical protein